MFRIWQVQVNSYSYLNHSILSDALILVDATSKEIIVRRNKRKLVDSSSPEGIKIPCREECGG